ncbi:MAG TPA: hypothetical protein VFC44_16990 [Candidatus Saccharimonadales bacterium]|nr:hypothetical protein [Candidatus Saccharimonadales bacterium]
MSIHELTVRELIHEQGQHPARQVGCAKRSSLGLALGVAVTPASTPERDRAQTVPRQVLGWFTSLRLLWADGGDTGDELTN